MDTRIGMRHSAVYDSEALKVPLVNELRELSRYRYLVWNLITRDLKVRYKRSALGFVWVMLNPLLTMAVLTIVFSTVFRFQQAHYSVFVLGGILLWGLYSQGSTAAMSSLHGSGHILRKLYVPPSAFVASAVGSGLVNFMFALAPFLLLALADHLTPTLAWFYLIVPAILVTMFTMGVGLVVSAMMVFFHDTYEIYQVLLQAFYFLTPVFYPLNALPVQIRSLERFNPLYLFISSFQNAVIYGTVPGLGQIAVSVVAALAVLTVGWVLFTKVEDKFVYHV